MEPLPEDRDQSENPDLLRDEEPSSLPENAPNPAESAATLAQKSQKPPEKSPSQTDGKSPIRDVNEWFAQMQWSENPFTFKIQPSLFVGYKNQTQMLLNTIKEKHKIILLVGPTGAGKTTTLRWVLEHQMPGFDYLFIAKPPKQPDDFVLVLNEKFKSPWFLQWFIPHIKNIYQVPEFLNKKTQKKHLVVLYDEAHESDIDVLEWLRVLCDQVSNMTIVLAGLSVFETETLSRLETLRKRIMTKVELLSLTKEETTEMIRRRIQDVGGTGDEFTDDTIQLIYQRTEGFPREVIRMANDIVNQAIRHNRTRMTPDLLVDRPLETAERPTAASVRLIEQLTPTQREVVEMLMQPMTPGQIANALDLSKYKSRQHAVRSMNNILKVLLEIGLVDRQKRDRAFVYQLKPHVKSLLIKA